MMANSRGRTERLDALSLIGEHNTDTRHLSQTRLPAGVLRPFTREGPHCGQFVKEFGHPPYVAGTLHPSRLHAKGGIYMNFPSEALSNSRNSTQHPVQPPKPGKKKKRKKATAN